MPLSGAKYWKRTVVRTITETQFYRTREGQKPEYILKDGELVTTIAMKSTTAAEPFEEATEIEAAMVEALESKDNPDA